LMTIGQFVFSVFLVGFALALNLPLALVFISVIGWSTVTQLMMMNMLIQLDVPDELRGRVFSFYLWAQQGVAPFGSLFFGVLAQAAGVPLAALVCGCICLVVVVLAHAKWPVLRKKTA
jgi:MFS family permease